MFCFTTKPPLWGGNDAIREIKMSTTVTATKTTKTQWAQISKTTTLPREAHIWCISLPALHLYDLKLPNFTLTSTTYETDDDFLFSFSFVQFVELENIYYEFTSKRVRLHLTEASSSPIFFSVFEKKNTGVHVAYSNRFRPSPLSQSRRRFRFPLIKTLKRWKYDSMIASLTRHTLYDE